MNVEKNLESFDCFRGSFQIFIININNNYLCVTFSILELRRRLQRFPLAKNIR